MLELKEQESELWLCVQFPKTKRHVASEALNISMPQFPRDKLKIMVSTLHHHKDDMRPTWAISEGFS